MTGVLKNILIFSTFFLLFAGFFHQINAFTQDLGRHLKMGEIIFQSYQIPKVNLFSYTYPDFPFINHHWFSEVVFYLISQIAGLNGLLVFTTVITLLAFSLIYFSALKKDNIFPITIVSILYLGILFERTDLRPEIFSFLFLASFLVILYRYRKRFTKFIFLLPLIEIFWVNMHIYFFVGLIVIGLFLVDLIVSYLINSNTKARNTKQILMNKNAKYKTFKHLELRILKIVSNFDIRISNLIFIFLLSCLVTFINPNGLDGAVYPLKVFQNYGYTIEENQNIHFLWDYSQKTTILFFTASVFLLFSTLILTIKKTKLVDWLLCLFFTFFAISMIRNFPLFVFGTFIPFVFGLTLIFKKIEQKFKKRVQEYLFLIKITGFLIIIGIILWQTTQIATAKKIGFGLTTGAGGGADFFLQNNLKGPLFNNFDIGSYLNYRLYPKEKVFIDGRPEAYPTLFFKEIYIPMQEDKDVFNAWAEKYKLNAVFFNYTDQTPWAKSFVKQIVNNQDWQLVYLDDYVMILVKNDYQNRVFINKFALNQNSKELDNIQIDDFTSLIRLAYLYKIIGWQEKETAIYEKILLQEPNSCFALYNLILLKQSQNSPLLPIYTTRYNLHCR